MEKGFRDIEEYFLSVAEKPNKPEKKKPQQKKEVNLIGKITLLNGKIRGKERKIKELYEEIRKLKEEIETIKKENKELSCLKKDKKILEHYKKETERLKNLLKEKEQKIKSYQSAELPKSRIELFIEVALNSITANITTKVEKKILFAKRFRRDITKEISCRPFLFESFMSAIARIDTTSRLLKRDNREIYRMRVTSPFGEFRAIYTLLDKNTIKFQRFGQRDSIYRELDACRWNFE